MSALDAFRAAFGDWNSVKGSHRGSYRDAAAIRKDAEMTPLLCLSCDEINARCDWYEYEERDVGWKGLKCPSCGVADNWSTEDD